MGGVGRQLLEERVEPGARRGQARLERIALARERIHLVLQQRIGALHFLVTHEQALDTFGDLFNTARCRHCLLYTSDAADE